LTISALIETIALWLAAAVALTFRVPAQEPEAALFAIIALTAIAMGSATPPFASSRCRTSPPPS
jgi:hypothetical protein